MGGWLQGPFTHSICCSIRLRRILVDRVRRVCDGRSVLTHEEKDLIDAYYGDLFGAVLTTSAIFQSHHDRASGKWS